MTKKTIKFTKDYFRKFKRNRKLINLVRRGFDVYTLENDPYSYSWNHHTFYEAAIKWGTPELVKTCIDMGANPNCVNLKRGAHSTPPAATSTLITAMRALRPDNLKVLLDNGADIRYISIDYRGGINWHLRTNVFPEFEHLQDFSENEQAEILKFKKCLDAGTEIINILKDAGFHFHGISPEDKNPSLYWLSFLSASSYGDTEKDEWYNKDPEEIIKEDAIHIWTDYEDFSEYYGTDGWVCLLPGHGSRPNALWHAVSPEALKEIMNAGIDVKTQDALGYSMIHHLAFYGGEDYYFKPDIMLQMLIDAGADVNEANEDGVCPLLLAAEEIRPNKKSLELVKVLLRNGADYTAKTVTDRDIKYWSSRYWYTTGDFENNILWEITSELIRSVTGESKLSNDDIDLMTAVFWGKPKDLKPILEHGANINAKTEHGYTPLMFASVYNNYVTVKFLVENGADMNLKNANGESALYLASLTGDKPVISTLVAKGAKKSCLSLPKPPRRSTTHIEFFFPK